VMRIETQGLKNKVVKTQGLKMCLTLEFIKKVRKVESFCLFFVFFFSKSAGRGGDPRNFKVPHPAPRRGPKKGPVARTIGANFRLYRAGQCEFCEICSL
jgi:hypothetical protein